MRLKESAAMADEMERATRLRETFFPSSDECILSNMWATRRLLQAAAASSRNGKTSTGLFGLPIHSRPLPHLLSVYSSTLSDLAALPSTAVYRQATEAITKQRIDVIKRASGEQGEEGGEAAVEKVEAELGLGVIEEVINIAEDERKLVAKVGEWKS
jgi:NADH dehydrogenase (ubiquinone) 1 alpha subcomplex subunit 5